MKGYIDNYNFAELDCQKYWQPPSTWSRDKTKQETTNRIFSGQWLGARKVDGALYVFLKDEDGNITLRGRSKAVSGEYLDKWDHLPHLHTWGATLPNGCCFLGEVYWPDKEGSKNTTSIMNCLTPKAIERQSKEENKLHYYIFDVLAYNGKSWLKKTAKERFSGIVDCMNSTDRTSSWWHYIEGAHYETGKELWDLLQNLLVNGYEGIVITQENALYEPGKRPSKTTMKIKKELKQTLDCFFTGKATPPSKDYQGKEIENWQYWVDQDTDERLPIGNHYYEAFMDGRRYIPVTKPYYLHYAGSLEIGLVKPADGRCRITPDSEWVDGLNIVPIGYLSGLTDEIKMNYKDYAGRVIEVGAMEITPDTGGLRHAKMLGWREDKTWQECTLDQLKDI